MLLFDLYRAIFLWIFRQLQTSMRARLANFFSAQFFRSIFYFELLSSAFLSLPLSQIQGLRIFIRVQSGLEFDRCSSSRICSQLGSLEPNAFATHRRCSQGRRNRGRRNRGRRSRGRRSRGRRSQGHLRLRGRGIIREGIVREGQGKGRRGGSPKANRNFLKRQLQVIVVGHIIDVPAARK